MGGILCATPPREKEVPITDLKVILRTKERDKITVTGATRVKLPRQTANDLNEAGQAASETPLARRRRMNARISQRRGEKKKSVIQIYQGAICSCTEPAAKLLTLYQEIDDSIKTDRMVAYLMITSMNFNDEGGEQLPVDHSEEKITVGSFDDEIGEQLPVDHTEEKSPSWYAEDCLPSTSYAP